MYVVFNFCYWCLLHITLALSVTWPISDLASYYISRERCQLHGQPVTVPADVYFSVQPTENNLEISILPAETPAGVCNEKFTALILGL